VAGNEDRLVYMTKDARETKLCDCISKVTVTDACTSEYVKVFLKYPIAARLVQKIGRQGA